MALLGLIAIVDDRFGITIDLEKLASSKNVADILNLLDSQIKWIWLEINRFMSNSWISALDGSRNDANLGFIDKQKHILKELCLDDISIPWICKDDRCW